MLTKLLIGLGFFCSVFVAVNGQDSIVTPPTNLTLLRNQSSSVVCVVANLAQTTSSRYSRVLPLPLVIISAGNTVLDSMNNTFSVSGTTNYTLGVTNVQPTHQGTYQCDLTGATLTNPPSAQFNIWVSDPPVVELMIYWNARGVSFTQVNMQSNLTCEAGRSRPPMTFRWFRGNTDVTANAVYMNSSVVDGYGASLSYLSLTPTQQDSGVMYRCVADIPGGPGYQNATLPVSFSSASIMDPNKVTILLPLLFIVLTKLSRDQ